MWVDNRDDIYGDLEIYYKRWDGNTWTPDERLTNNAASSLYPSVAADPSRNVHVMWEDQRDGNWEIYYKRWNGAAWTPDTRLTDNAASSRYPFVAADPSGNIHVVWSDDRASVVNRYNIYYKRGTPDYVGLEVPPAIAGPLRLSLRPNPFNPMTTIAFVLPTRARTTLAIYDPAGRLVAQPFDQLAAAGEYEVLWDGRGLDGAHLSSGVYFYRLESGGKKLTGRMVMVK